MIFKKYITVLFSIIFFHASSWAHHSEPGPQILLIGCINTCPAVFLLEAELMQRFFTKGFKLRIMHENIEHRADLERINVQAMRELLEVQIALSAILPPPSTKPFKIKNNLAQVLKDKNKISQIRQILEDLASRGLFISNNGKYMASNLDKYMQTIIHISLAKLDSEESLESFDRQTQKTLEILIRAFARERLFNFMDNNEISFEALEETPTDANEFSVQIYNDDILDPRNQPVINLFEKYENRRTNEMASNLFKCFLQERNNKSVIMTDNLGQLHARRIAAKLLKMGLPLEAIKIFYPRTNIKPLEEEAPCMFKKLSSELSFDKEIADFFSQLRPIDIKIAYTLNTKERSFELRMKKNLAIFMANSLTINMCFNPECDKEPKEIKLKLCSQCMLAAYCSSECQKKDWKTSHKSNCRK